MLVLALGVTDLVGFVVARSLVESTRPRWEDADSASETSDPDTAVEPGAETVDCPNCEVGNDPGYRYRRERVSELPTASRPGSIETPSLGRFVR